MNLTEVQPKDAAAVVLLRGENEICWAKRSAKLKFLSGWHAFPGGRLEESDFQNPVRNCDDAELAALVTCAARECFEEVGILLARGGEKMTKGQRASLHDDLLSGRMTFAEILAHWELWLDAVDFTFVGTWTTPPFSPIRFKTRFFFVNSPPKQEPYTASGELEEVEFIAADQGFQRWKQGEILCAPPILNTLRVFGGNKIETQRRRDAELERENLNNSFSEFSSTSLRLCVEKLRQLAESEGAHLRKVEFNPYVTLFPLRTFTLPPATHTNCFIVGRKEFIVIDAASTKQSEQSALHEFVDSLIESGGVCRAIVVSHLHPDHFGGERALQAHLQAKHGQQAPLITHRLTAEKLPEISFDRFIEDKEVFELREEGGEPFQMEVLHTPGHARGHLAFYVEKIGFLLSSDNVVGTGSVLIAPPEGNMRDYLDSLERLKNLPNLRSVCGSHGAAMSDARGKIESYITHRLEREAKILQAWQNGARSPQEIVAQVYADVQPELWRLAEKSVLAHLEKLQSENKI